MKTRPLVTIVLPVYNGQRTIKRTLESLLNQTYKDFELVIGIDGTKDQSKAIALSFKDERIKIVEHSKNLGLANNLNTLVKLSHKESQYIAIAEQDDWYVPERIEWQIETLNKYPNVGMVSGIAEFKSDKRRVLFPGLLVNGQQFPQRETLFKYLYVNQLKVVNTCLMWKKEVQEKHHIYFRNTYGNFNVDWDFILRYALVTDIYGITKKLVVMDRSSANRSVTKDKFAQNKASFQLLKDFKEEYPSLINAKTYREAIKYNYLLNVSLQPKLRLLFKSIYLTLRYADLRYIKYGYKRINKHLTKTTPRDPYTC